MASNPKTYKTFEAIIQPQFGPSLDRIFEVLSSLDEIDYDELSVENKIRYDLFLAYSMNGLAWVYMRTVGEDPAETIVKSELKRVKDFMHELQFVTDRKLMPRLDRAAVKQLCENALHDPRNKASSSKHIRFE